VSRLVSPAPAPLGAQPSVAHHLRARLRRAAGHCTTRAGLIPKPPSLHHSGATPTPGAKHWLVVGHPDAGPRLANRCTLVENARQAGVDVEAYLTALLTELPAHSVRRLGEWLPRAWQQRQQTARALGLTAEAA